MSDPFKELSTSDQVKTKWRQLASVHHPDRGGDGEVFDELHKLYTQALERVNRPKRCHDCHGEGRTKKNHGFAVVLLTCKTCKGTGRISP